MTMTKLEHMVIDNEYVAIKDDRLGAVSSTCLTFQDPTEEITSAKKDATFSGTNEEITSTSTVTVM